MTSTKTPAAAKERFGRGWVDSANDPDTGRWYGKYEFYQEDIDIIKAALEASPSSGLAEAVKNLKSIREAIWVHDSHEEKWLDRMNAVIDSLESRLKEQTGGSQG